VKMRKSLGNKRKEISPEQIEEITRLYADFIEGEKVKIFPNTAFGFQRITVERPLRLRWEITADTITQVTASKSWLRLSDDEQANFTARLRRLLGTMSSDPKTLQRKIGELPNVGEKTLLDALAVRDPDAAIVTKRNGEPEPDPELRDGEDVPLPDIPILWEEDPTHRLASIEYRSAIDDYMAAEVLPYVADAWVDHDKTRLGYEIPLTRQFYKYVPPRPLANIDAEIKQLESEIQGLLREVAE
jgi:type I restriction enzyme M protein